MYSLSPAPIKPILMLIDLNSYNEYWRLAPEPGPTNYLYANWQFTVGPGGEFVCEFLGDLAEAFIAVAPEFAVEDVALGEEIRVTCEEAIQYGLLGS
jgi:hypothetical protein